MQENPTILPLLFSTVNTVIQMPNFVKMIVTFIIKASTNTVIAIGLIPNTIYSSTHLIVILMFSIGMSNVIADMEAFIRPPALMATEKIVLWGPIRWLKGAPYP